MKIITFKVKEVEAPWTKLARSYRGWRNRRRQREQALKIAYEGAWAAARMGCQLPDLDALGFTEKQKARIVRRKRRIAQRYARQNGLVITGFNAWGDARFSAELWDTDAGSDPVTVAPEDTEAPVIPAATQPVSATGEVYDPRLSTVWDALRGFDGALATFRDRVDVDLFELQNRLKTLESSTPVTAGAAPAVSAPADSKAKELWDRVNRLQGQLAALEASVAERLTAAHTKADDNASAALQALETCDQLRAAEAALAARVETCERAIAPAVDPKKPISNQALVLKVAAITAADEATRAGLKALQERQDDLEGSLTALRKELEMETVGLPS